MKLLHTRAIRLNESSLSFDIGHQHIVLKTGEKIPAPQSGWQPKFLISFGPYSCLALQNGVDRGFWYLDQNFHLIASSSEQFLTLTAFSLSGSGSIRMSEVRSETGDMELAADASIFIDNLAHAMIRTGRDIPRQADDEGSPRHHAALAAMHRYNNNPDVTPVAIFSRAVSIEHFSRGYVSASDLDGNQIKIDLFLPLENFWWVGYSTDPACKLAFLISGHDKSAFAVYDLENNVYYIQTPILGLIDYHLCITALWRLFFFPKILDFKHSAKRVGLFFRENHIGHHVWNELSAVHDLLKMGKDVSIYTHASCDEPLFRLEEIFPNLQGHVHRNKGGVHHVLSILASGVAFFPYMSYLVSADMADRLITLSKEKEPVVFELLSALKKTHFLLLIGLRLENRSWVNQTAGYIALIKELAERSEKPVAIIFDGHNSSSHDPLAFIKSHNEVYEAGHLPPIIQQELEVIATVAAAIKQSGIDNVSIINQVPQSISLSILASAICNYFVTHWGAGLAKYKWIANADGCIISSRSVLEGKGDLRIYDLSDFREDVTELDYLDPSLVTDLGLATNIIKIENSRADFDLDPEAFARFVVPLALAKQ